MPETLVRISLKWATFGLVVRDGVVIKAPPIATWTLKRLAKGVITYYEQRGAIVETIEEMVD